MAAVLLVVVLWVVAGDLRVGGQGLQAGVEQSTVPLQLHQQLIVQLLALGEEVHVGSEQAQGTCREQSTAGMG